MIKEELKLFFNNYEFISNRCVYIIHELKDVLECNRPYYEDFDTDPKHENLHICYSDYYTNDLYYISISFDDFLGDIDLFIKNFKANVHK
jgi:hypothetical protein